MNVLNTQEFLAGFLCAVVTQDANALRAYFTNSACIRWNNTNEQFTPDEYVRANCEYPGSWFGEAERFEQIGNLAVMVARVWMSDNSVSFHVTSFFELEEDKIAVLNEYWGNDGAAPQWRIDKHIGCAIK